MTRALLVAVFAAECVGAFTALLVFGGVSLLQVLTVSVFGVCFNRVYEGSAWARRALSFFLVVFGTTSTMLIVAGAHLWSVWGTACLIQAVARFSSAAVPLFPSVAAFVESRNR